MHLFTFILLPGARHTWHSDLPFFEWPSLLALKLEPTSLLGSRLSHSKNCCVLGANYVVLLVISLWALSASAANNVIEEQLKAIGSVPNDEVVVVQRQFTSKKWRHEFSPMGIGGIPFGTVRRTMVAGANYTLHLNDWLAWEGFNFLYSKNFFSSFTDDINKNQNKKIAVDFQKLIYLATTGFQITPTYGKVSTFSWWIAYLEPFITIGAGVAKTEVREYFAIVPGIGARFFFKEWFSMRVELRDYIFTERYADHSKAGSPQATATRNNYSVMLSLSFWLPKMPG